MKIIIHTVCSILVIGITGCSTKFNPITIVDDSLSPIGCKNQLVLLPDRGEIGHYSYPEKSSEPLEEYRRSGSGAKRWLLNNCGQPDYSYSESGTDYLVYERRSKDFPNYNMQYMSGERQVKLGYRNDKLVYISAVSKNYGKHMKWPVYVLPR